MLGRVAAFWRGDIQGNVHCEHAAVHRIALEIAFLSAEGLRERAIAGFGSILAVARLRLHELAGLVLHPALAVEVERDVDVVPGRRRLLADAVLRGPRI